MKPVAKKLTDFNKIPKSYKEKLKVYSRGKESAPEMDWSDASALECFNWETHGGERSKNNGFAYGKWGLDIAISSWKEDLMEPFPYMLTLRDLREDYPEAFLKSVLGKKLYSKCLLRSPLPENSDITTVARPDCPS